VSAIFEFLNSHSGTFLILVLFVLLFISYQFSQINRKLSLQKKKYDMLLRGRGELNMGELIQAHSTDIFEMEKKVNELESEIKTTKSKFAFTFQKIGFVKYDAFHDLKNKLSYTIAILDGFNNGLLLTTIYGRESCITYAKEVNDGIVNQELSKEEYEALRMALEK
jgi:hypothetical protein